MLISYFGKWPFDGLQGGTLVHRAIMSMIIKYLGIVILQWSIIRHIKDLESMGEWWETHKNDFMSESIVKEKWKE